LIVVFLLSFERKTKNCVSLWSCSTSCLGCEARLKVNSVKSTCFYTHSLTNLKAILTIVLCNVLVVWYAGTPGTDISEVGSFMLFSQDYMGYITHTPFPCLSIHLVSFPYGFFFKNYVFFIIVLVDYNISASLGNCLIFCVYYNGNLIV
jgi:hypothetical protein